nr:MAG TPA: hypothetical protein [Caudoviricetes sp.]
MRPSGSCVRLRFAPTVGPLVLGRRLGLRPS